MVKEIVYAPGQAQLEPVELGRELQLAAQPRVLSAVVREVEHVLLFFARGAHRRPPFRIHVHVAGGAGHHARARALDVLGEQIRTVTIAEILEREPETRAEIEEELKNNVWAP